MKNFHAYASIITLSLLCSITSLYAIVAIKGSSTTAGVTFNSAVVCQAYHQPTRTWYVGLADGDNDYSLGKVSQTGTDQIPTFSAIGSNAAVSDAYVGNLALSTSGTNVTQPIVVFTTEATPTTFKITNYNGNNYVASSALKDGNATPATTGKVLKVIATPDFAIAAVQANGDTDGTFGGGTDDGLTLTRINRGTTNTLTNYDATNGTTATPKALVINGAAATGMFGVVNISVPTTFYDMVYNDDLKRVYVSSLITGSGAVGDEGFGVVIVKVDPTANTLTKLNQCANRSTVLDGDTRIVGFASNTGVVALRKLEVIKTSSGFYYLITNGRGAAAATGVNTRNGIYAVALVSGNNSDIDGTFAKNDVLTTTTFTAQATGAGDIAAHTSAQALVGGGNLPITDSTSTIFVSDMKVVGDTVYVSVSSTVTGSTDQAGIYYSQALLNHVGKIASWTDWAKAAPQTLGDDAGSVKAIAVDATTCDVWAIAPDGLTVKKTEWTKTGAATTSLIAKLNSSLSSGCFSAFDANQSLESFGDVTQYRYALFGGRGKVVFAKTGVITAACVNGTFTNPQTVTTDFSLATNYLETTISGDSAPVTALGYTQGATGAARGYFLAGTKNGLYAWATGGAGFDVANLAHLNAIPFTGYAWQAVTALTGEVRTILSTQNAVYVLTRDVATSGTTIQDKVYSILPAATVGGFTIRTLATSGTAPGLTTATLFFDIGVMIGAADSSSDKLLLATNDGIYQSAVGVQADTNQTDATWAQVTDPATDELIYDLIAQPTHTRKPIMAWASAWADSNAGDLTYTRSTLTQITSIDTTTTMADNPNGTFNSNSATLFTSFLPIKAFWSDGARRIWIGIEQDFDGKKIQLYAQPYKVGSTDWNISAQQGALTDLVLNSHDRFYWVQAIGATGTIFAGSSKGVVCLG